MKATSGCMTDVVLCLYKKVIVPWDALIIYLHSELVAALYMLQVIGDTQWQIPRNLTQRAKC